MVSKIVVGIGFVFAFAILVVMGMIAQHPDITKTPEEPQQGIPSSWLYEIFGVPATLTNDSCENEYLKVVSVYGNNETEPLWTELNISSPYGFIGDAGYKQDHTFLTCAYVEKMTFTVTGVYNQTTGNVTKTNSTFYLYPMNSEYNIHIAGL